MSEEQDEKEFSLQDLELTVVTGGRTYKVRVADFSAHEEMEYKNAVGRELMDVFSNQASSYAVAGLVWLLRKRHEKQLTFRKVAQTFKLGDLESLKLSTGDDDDSEPAGAEVVDELPPEG